MIALSEIFNMLSGGEFANLSISRNSTGGLDESEYDRIISNLNLGMVEIFKRFELREEEITLYVDTTRSKYYLRPRHMAVSSDIDIANELYILIDDDDDGSLNIVEIKELLDSDGSIVKDFNNRHTSEDVSIIKLAPDTLKFTGLEESTTYTVIYQAWPSEIEITRDFKPSEINVEIPYIALEALLYYIAARVFRPLGGKDGGGADVSDKYQQQYELACQKIEMYGLDLDKCDKEDRFDSEGWT